MEVTLVRNEIGLEDNPCEGCFFDNGSEVCPLELLDRDFPDIFPCCEIESMKNFIWTIKPSGGNDE